MPTVEQLLDAWRSVDAQAWDAEMLVRRAFEDQLTGGTGPTVDMIRTASQLREEATAALARLTGRPNG